jgi:hypothetical protein
MNRKEVSEDITAANISGRNFISLALRGRETQFLLMFSVIICSAVYCRGPYNVSKICMRGRELFFMHLLFSVELSCKNRSRKLKSSF